jgi:hypothetical protein
LMWLQSCTNRIGEEEEGERGRKEGIIHAASVIKATGTNTNRIAKRREERVEGTGN